MIKISRSRAESRKRDVKRKRFLLQVGKKRWHLSHAEVSRLYNQFRRIF